MKRIRQFILQGLLILLPVVLVFAVLEGAARIVEIWNPPMQVDIGQGFDRDSLLFHPVAGGFMETNPDKEVSFQKQRFQMPKPARTMRIFALGGSSVNYLNYEFSVMAQELQQAWSDRFDTVEIINCGGLSYGTHRLVLILAEVLHYEPDLVLVYSGHNEFEELQQLHLSHLEFATAQRTLGYSALYRFIRDMRAQRQIAALQEARERRELATALPDTSKTWAYEFTEEETAARMDAYRDNLAAIITTCQNKGVPIIIGTVPSNLWKPNLPGEAGVRYEEVLRLFEAGRYEEGMDVGRKLLRKATPRHQSSDVENTIIRQLAQEYNVPLVDVKEVIRQAEPHHVPGETLFSDHCHLNVEGNSLLRRAYQEKILATSGF
jgi:hypothetical protein